jgi:hypothetical protein
VFDQAVIRHASSLACLTPGSASTRRTYSADIAEQEWQRLSAKFSEQLNGLDHVVQMAEVNGRIFHRLRVVGLEDLAEASAFCETFVARNTACLPVVMR